MEGCGKGTRAVWGWPGAAGFSQAVLDDVNLKEADLSAVILSGTRMSNVQGLTDEQLRDCVARGAVVEQAASQTL